MCLPPPPFQLSARHMPLPTAAGRGRRPTFMRGFLCFSLAIAPLTTVLS